MVQYRAGGDAAGCSVWSSLSRFVLTVTIPGSFRSQVLFTGDTPKRLAPKSLGRSCALPETAHQRRGEDSSSFFFGGHQSLSCRHFRRPESVVGEHRPMGTQGPDRREMGSKFVGFGGNWPCRLGAPRRVAIRPPRAGTPDISGLREIPPSLENQEHVEVPKRCETACPPGYMSCRRLVEQACLLPEIALSH